MRKRYCLALLAMALTIGCAGVPLGSVDNVMLARGAADSDASTNEKRADNGEKNGNGKSEDEKKPAKTLFSWAIGPPDAEEGDNDPEDDEIVTDRPDFTEASSTVGRHVQLESGYTYIFNRDNGVRTRQHSFPETLLRFGMFSEWLEGRVAWNYGRQDEFIAGGGGTNFSGGEDLYLGVKLGLTEQKQYLPEMALILQMTVPTGIDESTANATLPGFNFLYGWDINDFLAAGGSFQMNRARDDDAHSYLETAVSGTVNYTLTKKLGAYTEYFALFPSGAVAPDVCPEHYFDGGFTYKVTRNVQLDLRAGVGLNDHADDYFAGAGLSVRY